MGLRPSRGRIADAQMISANRAAWEFDEFKIVIRRAIGPF
jgi:hypothetical protein